MSDIGGRWRRIYSLEWHTGAFQGLGDAERVVYFYARTGPQSTSVGIYRISTAVAVEDIGNLTAVDFDYRLSRVCEAFDWSFDSATRVIWIPTWIPENPPQSPNVCKSWRKLLANLPDCDLKAEAADSIVRYLKALPKGFAEAFGSLPKDWQISKSKPKALPESKTESNQGTGDSGIQRSGKKRTGALRAGAMNEGASRSNGLSIVATSPLAAVAHETLKITNPNGPIDELIDTCQWLLSQKNNGKSYPRADVVDAINVAIAERRSVQ